MSDQLRANLVRKACGDFIARLRRDLGQTGEDANPAVDKLTPAFTEELHAATCERLGLRAEASNLVNHPWRRPGWAKKSR